MDLSKEPITEFKAVAESLTAPAMALQPGAAGLRDTFFSAHGVEHEPDADISAVHVREKKPNQGDQTKATRTLMASGDEDVLDSGRLNPHGKTGTMAHASKAEKRRREDLVRQIMSDLQELQHLYNERDRIQAEIDELARQIFTAAELEELNQLSEEDSETAVF